MWHYGCKEHADEQFDHILFHNIMENSKIESKLYASVICYPVSIVGNSAVYSWVSKRIRTPAITPRDESFNDAVNKQGATAVSLHTHIYNFKSGTCMYIILVNQGKFLRCNCLSLLQECLHRFAQD
jgi:hypothetical protein